MNVNQKLPELSSKGGIPKYNNAINRLVKTVNWLLGMQTDNGQPVTETAKGPVISTITPGVSLPLWLTDPEGQPAGWMKVWVINPNQPCPASQIVWEQWVWTTKTRRFANLQWLVDPNGNVATWIMGKQGGVWGTGGYPGGPTGNFQQSKWIYTGALAADGHSPAYRSPWSWNVNPVTPPIPIPAGPPAFYFKAPNLPGGHAPSLWIGSGASSIYPNDSISWNWVIIYDGTTLVNLSGSNTSVGTDPTIYIPIDPTGWVFDPTNIPGYSQGSGAWIFEYQGPVSANPNPQIVVNFTFTTGSGYGSVQQWGITYITA